MQVRKGKIETLYILQKQRKAIHLKDTFTSCGRQTDGNSPFSSGTKITTQIQLKPEMLWRYLDSLLKSVMDDEISPGTSGQGLKSGRTKGTLDLTLWLKTCHKFNTRRCGNCTNMIWLKNMYTDQLVVKIISF